MAEQKMQIRAAQPQLAETNFNNLQQNIQRQQQLNAMARQSR